MCGEWWICFALSTLDSSHFDLMYNNDPHAIGKFSGDILIYMIQPVDFMEHKKSFFPVSLENLPPEKFWL